MEDLVDLSVRPGSNHFVIATSIGPVVRLMIVNPTS